MLRVHTVPYSTNADRVALAAGLKGLELEWVEHDALDRSAIVALSGQELVPVLETPDGELVTDSPVILRWLDEQHPDPPLWPREPAARAWADVFVEWFNGVWKGPPNALADHPGSPDDGLHVEALARWRDTIEGLLARTPYLQGDAPTVADVVAYPFLRYGVGPHDPADTHPFHEVLRRHVALGPDHERTRAWIARMDALPRA